MLTTRMVFGRRTGKTDIEKLNGGGMHGNMQSNRDALLYWEYIQKFIVLIDKNINVNMVVDKQQNQQLVQKALGYSQGSG